jgi:hypothetical protein
MSSDKRNGPPGTAPTELEKSSVHDFVDENSTIEATSASPTYPSYDPAAERKLIRKIDWFILPVVSCASSFLPHSLYIHTRRGRMSSWLMESVAMFHLYTAVL